MTSFLKKFTLFFISVLFMVSCGDSSKTPPKVDPAITEYVSAFTAGIVSSEAKIRVIFNKNVLSAKPSETADKNLFDFSPNIDGQAIWVDSRTLEFTPEEPMKNGKLYKGNLDLTKLFSNVPSELEELPLHFQIINQGASVLNTRAQSYSNTELEWNKVSGSILMNDVADISEIEELLSAKQDGERLKVSWVQGADRKRFSFTVDSVSRSNTASQVNLKWKSDWINEQDKVTSLEIPALGDFKIMDVQAVSQPAQHVVITFSDPLQEGQNLKGLITISRAYRLSYQVNKNQLKVMFGKRLTGTQKVTVFPGIKNVMGYQYKKTYPIEITFDEHKPQVAFISNGEILPGSSEKIVPFKAVNLKAVDVTVFRIYEDNVFQFLQVNRSINGNSELKRVARPVARKVVKLYEQNTKNLHSWNNYALDLSDLIEEEPGAIYRIQLGFRKEYALFGCLEESNELEIVAEEDEAFPFEENFDTPFENNYYYWWGHYIDGYSYRERDNPCDASYYNPERFVHQNILASNLAITVKGSQNNKYLAVVTDIISGNPVKGAEVTFYNYQERSVGKGTTDGDGFLEVSAEATAFMAVAEYQSNKAYKRLADNTSLSLSNFETSGADVSHGVNGMLYAERGVWRPGDSIYLNFILQDKEHIIPEGHPIIFEMRDPSGNMVEREVQRTSDKKIYKFWTKTLAEAPTGNYNAKIKVGGASFYKRLKIETVKPNRLRIALEFGDEVLRQQNSATLNVEWLTGATAKNLKAKIESSIRLKKEPFENFKNFVFQDPSRSFHSYDRTVFEGKVDQFGSAEMQLKLSNYHNAPGMLESVFFTTVYEQGGDFSTDVLKMPYAPFDAFVGLKTPKPEGYYLETDKPLNFEIVSVDEHGTPINRAGLEVDVYRIDWSWWWGSSNRNLANYINSEYKEIVYTKKIDTRNGKGSFSLELKYPDYGRYLVRVCDPESGHCTGEVVYVDWPYGRSKEGRKMPGAATMLLFNSDKEKYQIGETGTLTIPTSASGKLLVSFESGADVISQQWVNATAGKTEVEFDVTEEMAPNVYAFVSYIQPHENTSNDLPVRMYGVIPINVDNPNAILEPVVKIPKVIEPESTYEIEVHEKNGKPMTYTIAVVDEGLLNLTRFKTPDPFKHFFAKQALGVRTWDMFDEVIGAYGGKVEQMFAIGGDDELSEEEKKSKRFIPVVRFLGPFKMKANGKAKHTIDMPNYIGSVRTMVVAAEDEAYGSTEVNTPVKKPLMIYGTMPRVVGPGETIKLPVQVFALEDFVKDVKLKVTTNEFFTAETSSKEISFSEIGDQITGFELKVGEKTGLGKVTVVATSGNERSVYEVEIAVRNPNNYQVISKSFVLEKGDEIAESVEGIGTYGTNTFSVEVSQIPDLNLQEHLSRLIRYPHGCMEQSTSSIFPQVALLSVLQDDAESKKQINSYIKAYLNKMKMLQSHDGGFKLWSGDSYPDLWVSSYVGHAMLEIEKNGYEWPVGMKENWIAFQQQKARSWRRPAQNSNRYYRRNEDVLQAYRLYTLALIGKPELGAMNRMKQLGNLNNSAKWRLATAYALAGQKSTAKSMVNQLGVGVEAYDFSALTYGSPLRDKAMILEALVKLEEDNRAFEMAIEVAKDLNNGSWYSTQTTAYSLLGLAEFLKTRNSDIISFDYKIDGKGETMNTKAGVHTIPIDSKIQEAFKFNLTNTSEDKIYVRIVNEGQPKNGLEQAIQKGLSVTVLYTDRDGFPIDVTELKQGTDFIAKVNIAKTGNLRGYQNMALTQIFPSGWEIINLRLMGREESESQLRYRDYRDDRVMTYFSLPSTQSVTYRIWLNAAYGGEYYLSGPKVEDMYDNRIESITEGKWVKVVK